MCEADAAQLVTRPLLGFAGRLALNVDAGPGGQVDIQVIRAADNTTLATALPLAAINDVHAEAAWAPGTPPLDSLAATPVRLVLRMQACRLYALSFPAA